MILAPTSGFSNSMPMRWRAADRDSAIELDFTGCIFLHQHAVAFLGGLIRTLQDRGCTIGARLKSINPTVQQNLQEEWFMKAMGLQQVAGGPQIPSRFEKMRRATIRLTSGTSGTRGSARGWVNVTDRVADAIGTQSGKPTRMPSSTASRRSAFQLWTVLSDK